MGNVVFQIRRLFELADPLVHERTLYVGDPVRDLYTWVNGFSQALTGRSARVVPRAMVRTIALAGDVVTRVGGRFPITSSRFRSMVEDYPVPIDRSLELFGSLPFSLEIGIERTLEWLTTPEAFVDRRRPEAGCTLRFAPRRCTAGKENKNWSTGRLTGRQHIRQYEPSSLRSLARKLNRWLDAARPDLVFTDTSIVAASLNGSRSVALWMDSHLAVMDGYYDYFSNLSQATRRRGLAVEQAAFSKSALVLFASEWAASSAIEQYSLDASKVHVLPFGANLEITHGEAEVVAMIRARSEDPIVLTFFGVDWNRKGGDVALQVTQQLNAAGIPTRLDVIGCRFPDRRKVPDCVREHGFLDKGNPDHARRLRRQLVQSHFLILPSRSECFGIVFAEASAYGVPSLATRGGGIPSAVLDGVNGILFSLDAGADAYVTTIRDLARRPEAYRALALSSFHAYETRLNWSSSFCRLRTLAQACLSAEPRVPCEGAVG